MKDKQIKPIDDEIKWKKVLISAIIILIVTIIGATATYYFQMRSIQEQNKLERQNIANALYTEINQLEPIINGIIANPGYATDTNSTGVIMQQPVFLERSVYYSNQKEIASFDRNLSSHLATFYWHLEWAENNRLMTTQLYEKVMMYPKDTSDQRELSLYYRAESHTSYLATINGLKVARQLIPIIKT